MQGNHRCSRKVSLNLDSSLNNSNILSNSNTTSNSNSLWFVDRL